MRKWTQLLVMATAMACAACGTDDGNSGGSATDDATTAADSLGDSAGDAPAGTDAAADAPHANDVADTTGGAVDTVLAADVPTAMDVAGPDAKAVDTTPDSNKGPDVDTSICTPVCNHIAAAKCPQDDPEATCIQNCVDFETNFLAKCPTQIQAYMQCVSTTTITCVDGKTDQSICATEDATMSACMSGTTPGGCGTGTCYGGTGPGGAPTCGCETTCNSVDIKLDCDGTNCKCTKAGAVSKTFPQGAACTGDVSSFLQSACVP